MAYAYVKEHKHGRTIYVRWKRGRGDYPTATRDEHGRPFRSLRQAKQWGEAREADARRGLLAGDPRRSEMTLEEWVNNHWWPAYVAGLKRKTREDYRYHLEVHILPVFGQRCLGEITPAQVAEWLENLRRDGYAANTISNARARLVTILGDAVADGIISANPAHRRRKRGRVTREESAEKVWATPLQALLVAERCAALTGRDDDLVFILALAYLGLRWGEGVGLTHEDVELGRVHVRQQIAEGDRFYRETPKDESRRTLDLPPFLADLLSELKMRRHKVRCRCTPPEQDAVEDACPGGGHFLFLGPAGGHIRASNFRDRIFYPSAYGWYPGMGGANPRPARPVLVDISSPWPGSPVPAWPPAVPGQEFTPPRGRGVRRYDPETVHLASWLPVLPGLTPHGLRHSHQVWMDQIGLPEPLQVERMGHKVSGIRAVYRHVTPQDRARLKDGLQTLWRESLEARFALAPHSLVPMLDAMLEPLRAAAARRRLVRPRARKGEVRRLRRAGSG